MLKMSYLAACAIVVTALSTRSLVYAETGVFGCEGGGIGYPGAGETGRVPGPTTPFNKFINKNNDNPSSGDAGGTKPSGSGPTTGERSNQQKSASIVATEQTNPNGERSITISGPATGGKTLTGRPIPQPEPTVAACSPARVRLAECGPGKNGPGTDVRCPAGQYCDNCFCKAECPAPPSQCGSGVLVCSAGQTCNKSNPANCLCQGTVGKGPAPLGRVDLNKVFNPFGGTDSLSGRANRGGNWYILFDDTGYPLYPGYRVNIAPQYVGEELQVYFPGWRQTYAKQSGTDNYHLVREDDAYGNQTRYVRDPQSWNLLRKEIESGTGGILVEYLTLPSGNGYRLETSRCSDSGFQDCTSINQPYEYTFDSLDRMLSAVELNPAPYVAEPVGNGVHNLTTQLQGPITTTYTYLANTAYVTSIAQSRGNVTLTTRYEYYQASHPQSGKLKKVIDVDGKEYNFTYGADSVTRTDPLGGVTHGIFDQYGRIISQTETVAAGTGGGITSVGVRYEYAVPSTCDRVVSKVLRNSGDDVYREVMNTTWDVGEFRVLSRSITGPNGNTLTTTYDDYVDWMDGNFAQTITTPLGTTRLNTKFDMMSDANDSRQRLVALTAELPSVTSLNGNTYTARSETIYSATGQVEREVYDGLSTKYEYDSTSGLLVGVHTGPATASGAPDLSHAASYSIQLERDKVTGEVVTTVEGDPQNPKITNFIYDNGALVESRSGGRVSKTYYSIWGDVAAQQIKALNAAGEPFAPGARTWWSYHTIRDALGLRVLAQATDAGDPRLPTSDFWFTRYVYNGLGFLERTIPHFGHATYYKYNGWGQVESVHRDSASGLLLAEYSSTANSENRRFLVGESPSGAATYQSVIKNYSPEGYLTSINSSNGRELRISYSDLGQTAGYEALINGTLVAKSATEYDEWSRAIRYFRFNPRTDEKELLSSLIYRGLQLESVINKDGVTAVSYRYGAGNELLSEITPTSSTQYEYGAGTGSVSRITLRNGTNTQVYEYLYNDLEEITKIRNLGDGAQRAIETRFSYDTLGQSYVTRPDGVTPYSLVDALGRTWEEGIPGEVAASYRHTLDRAQNTYSVSQTVPGEGTETRVYGPFGLVSTSHTDGRTSGVNYSANGFVVSATGADGAVVTVRRDEGGRDIGADIKSAAGLESWVIGRDGEDRIDSLVRIQNNQTSQFAVTRRGDYGEILETEHTEPGRAPLTYAYDRNGPKGYDPDRVYGLSVGGASWNKKVEASTGRLKELNFVGGPYPENNPAKFEFFYNGSTKSGVKYPTSTGLESVWSYVRGVLSDVIITQNGQPVSGAQFDRDDMGRAISQRTLGGAGQGKSFEYVGDKLSKSKEPVSNFGANYAANTGTETRNVYSSTNPQQLQSRILSSGKVVNYLPDAKGAYTSIDGMAIKYDALRRVVQFGPFSYVYRGSSLLPVEVKKNGKLVRTFIYDMFNNLMASVDAKGRREDYLTQGTVDLGLLDPATGKLKTAYVTFPGPSTPREKLAAIHSDGTAHFYTNLTSSQRIGAYDQNGNLVEKSETNLGAETYSTLAPNGTVRASSVTRDNSGYHGMRVFTDAGPGSGLVITPLRAFFQGYAFANSPDPLKVLGQMFSWNDNNPANKTDPTGGQTAYEFYLERVYSNPETAQRHLENNIALVNAVFEEEWKTDSGNWAGDFGLRLLQTGVQGLFVAPLAATAVLLLPASAVTVIGAGATGLAGVNTGINIAEEGFTGGNAADAVGVITGLGGIGKLAVTKTSKIVQAEQQVITGAKACNNCDEKIQAYLTVARNDPNFSLERAKFAGIGGDDWLFRAQNNSFVEYSTDGGVFIPLNPKSVAATTVFDNHTMGRLAKWGDLLRAADHSGRFYPEGLVRRKWTVVRKYGCAVEDVAPSLNVGDLPTARLYFTGKMDADYWAQRQYNRIFVFDSPENLVKNGKFIVMNDLGVLGTESKNAILLVGGAETKVPVLAIYEPMQGDYPGSWSMPD